MLSTILTRFKSTSQPPIWHGSAEVVRGDSPIAVDEEITDNRMLLEALLVEFSDLVGINPYDTMMYDILDQFQSEPQRRAAMLLNWHYGEERNDWDDSAQVARWLVTTEPLPKNFRCLFANFIIRTDELEEHVSFLSQSRWEKLRTWSCGNV